MLIAKQKRRENIAEYILYLWQIEDLLRALNFDEIQIRKILVEPLQVDENTKTQVNAWYMGIVQLLQFEKKQQSGHASHSLHLIADLNDVHLHLLQRDEKYVTIYDAAKPLINDFAKKLEKHEESELELCFHALYARMLLSLKNQEISTETQQAIDVISKMIAYLSAKYLRYESGEEKWE
ncbi:MAG: DUF4924 family protein [Prevotellaceae bacterium]|jgi:DNA polymerase III psi subunit|nr:DUF4924 family protein [Prevotellaceae bacterium]